MYIVIYILILFRISYFFFNLVLFLCMERGGFYSCTRDLQYNHHLYMYGHLYILGDLYWVSGVSGHQ